MSVNSILISTVHVPNPAGVNGDEGFDELNSRPEFELDSEIQILSTNSLDAGSDIYGLLYVPDIDPSDPCRNQLAPYIPSHAYESYIPNPNEWPFFAFAPWISAPCTQSLLAAARKVNTVAFIFYLTDNSSAQPPPVSSEVWNLNDGGQWKQENEYPVFAVPSSSGQRWMPEAAAYSGNLSSEPEGTTSGYPLTDFLRLSIEVDINGTGALPTLWDFLLVAMAVLACVIGGISFTMHLVQRYRRNQLRRRITSGQLDLEALGVKRLTVPQDVLDKMPLYVFGKESVEEQKPHIWSRDKTSRQSVSGSQDPYAQATCAICLEDFVLNETRVREMPCRHIFHPECIDDFLRKTSSLCPLCKKSGLPAGYCPMLITNGMVRRERLLRERHDSQLRASQTRVGPNGEVVPCRTGAFAHLQNLLNVVTFRRVANATNPPPQTQVEVSLEPMDSARDSAISPDTRTSISAPDIPPPARTGSTVNSSRRREWARRRAAAMVGQPADPVAQDAGPVDQRPVWRRIFPGFG